MLNFYEHNYENYGFNVQDIKHCELEYGISLNINPEEENINFKVYAKYFKNDKNNNKNYLFGIEAEYIFKFKNFKTVFRLKADSGFVH